MHGVSANFFHHCIYRHFCFIVIPQLMEEPGVLWFIHFSLFFVLKEKFLLLVFTQGQSNLWPVKLAFPLTSTWCVDFFARGSVVTTFSLVTGNGKTMHHVSIFCLFFLFIFVQSIKSTLYYYYYTWMSVWISQMNVRSPLSAGDHPVKRRKVFSC